MLVRVTVTRIFEMDERRILEYGEFEPPPADAPPDANRRWLEESFWELCGFERDQDHVDGSFVKSVEEDAETDYEWPMALRG